MDRSTVAAGRIASDARDKHAKLIVVGKMVTEVTSLGAAPRAPGDEFQAQCSESRGWLSGGWPD